MIEIITIILWSIMCISFGYSLCEKKQKTIAEIIAYIESLREKTK